MVTVSALLSGLTLLAISPAAGAGDAPPPATDDPIVVTGERQTPEQIRDAAVSYVHAVGFAQGNRPAGRWLAAICPHVVGLNRDHAAIVETRIRTIAMDAGIRVARPGCRSNIVVSFVSDGADLVRRVARRSRQLADVQNPQRDRLLTGAAPIRWWYTSETTSRDGAATGDSGVAGAVNNAEGGGSGIPQGDGIGSISQYTSSIVSTLVVRGLRSASVVVDVNRSAGVSLSAVADFAAFVALAEVTPPDDAPDRSILGLFGPRPVTQLTATDRAFLTSVYQLRLDREARMHRGLIVRSLVAAASGDQAAQPAGAP